MTGYELSPEQFDGLMRMASRHHRKQIADWLSLTAHLCRGEIYFRISDGAEVPLQEVYRRCQADAELRRRAYNLCMHYR